MTRLSDDLQKCTQIFCWFLAPVITKHLLLRVISTVRNVDWPGEELGSGKLLPFKASKQEGIRSLGLHKPFEIHVKWAVCQTDDAEAIGHN